MDGHIYKSFDKELHDLKERLLLVGGRVERAIRDAIKALEERNSDTAEKIIAEDDVIDSEELEIDEFCLRLLALRQPAARDLRFITTAIKINYDLERIGDMAVNISERVLELNKEPQLKPYITLPQMALSVQQMLRDSLNSFVNEDPIAARAVVEEDEKVDHALNQIYHELVNLMAKDYGCVPRATRLLFISKYLERIADHAVNIAELVVFMVEGKILRHHKHHEGEND
ncbi:MAG: phosphate signaling complex protein PhoU [Deltaproteobacteria bacterium]|nr:phosphate signaling complex protein PhoU [Deltaproteobacteria bacterium]